MYFSFFLFFLKKIEQMTVKVHSAATATGRAVSPGVGRTPAVNGRCCAEFQRPPPGWGWELDVVAREG